MLMAHFDTRLPIPSVNKWNAKFNTEIHHDHWFRKSEISYHACIRSSTQRSNQPEYPTMKLEHWCLVHTTDPKHRSRTRFNSSFNPTTELSTPRNKEYLHPSPILLEQTHFIVCLPRKKRARKKESTLSKQNIDGTSITTHNPTPISQSNSVLQNTLLQSQRTNNSALHHTWCFDYTFVLRSEIQKEPNACIKKKPQSPLAHPRHPQCTHSTTLPDSSFAFGTRHMHVVE